MGMRRDDEGTDGEGDVLVMLGETVRLVRRGRKARDLRVPESDDRRSRDPAVRWNARGVRGGNACREWWSARTKRELVGSDDDARPDGGRDA